MKFPKHFYKLFEPFRDTLDKQKRYQMNFNFEQLFPMPEKGICRCGCGKATQKHIVERVLKPTRRKRTSPTVPAGSKPLTYRYEWYEKWYNEEHLKSALDFYWLIKGNAQHIKKLLCFSVRLRLDRYEYELYGTCNHCKGDYEITKLDLDHILEVVKGGGACDISNYQLLCKPCHKAKTKSGLSEYRRSKKNVNQQCIDTMEVVNG